MYRTELQAAESDKPREKEVPMARRTHIQFGTEQGIYAPTQLGIPQDLEEKEKPKYEHKESVPSKTCCMPKHMLCRAMHVKAGCSNKCWEWETWPIGVLSSRDNVLICFSQLLCNFIVSALLQCRHFSGINSCTAMLFAHLPHAQAHQLSWSRNNLFC